MLCCHSGESVLTTPNGARCRDLKPGNLMISGSQYHTRCVGMRQAMLCWTWPVVRCKGSSCRVWGTARLHAAACQQHLQAVCVTWTNL